MFAFRANNQIKVILIVDYRYGSVAKKAFTDNLLHNVDEVIVSQLIFDIVPKIAAKYKDEHVIHNLVWSYIDVYKANSTKECKKPLELIYDKLTCGIRDEQSRVFQRRMRLDLLDSAWCQSPGCHSSNVSHLPSKPGRSPSQRVCRAA